MDEIDFDQLLEVIRGTQVSYHKLIVIAGHSGSGKTSVLTRVADHLDAPVMNLSLLLSQRLLSSTKRQRRMHALEVARELIDEQSQACACVDNTEMLFDSALSLNPLQFLQDVSRNRLIVSTWNGEIADRFLSFGYPTHPDFFRQPIAANVVVSILTDKLYLH